MPYFNAQFLASALSGLITGAVAGMAADEISESYGIPNPSAGVMIAVASAVAAIIPAVIIVCTGLFKNAAVTRKLCPGLAIPAVFGAGAGVGFLSYQTAIAAGASALGASVVAALSGSLTTIGTGLLLEHHYNCSEMGTGAAAPLLLNDEQVAIAADASAFGAAAVAFAPVGTGLDPQDSKTGTGAAGPDLCP